MSNHDYLCGTTLDIENEILINLNYLTIILILCVPYEQKIINYLKKYNDVYINKNKFIINTDKISYIIKKINCL